MPERIRIQIGDTEIEYEGEEFTPEIASELIRRAGELASVVLPRSSDLAAGKPINGTCVGNTNSSFGTLGTTQTIAATLQATSGNELVIAAAAHLTFVAGKEEFTRQELLDEARSATGYYRESFGKNFTNYMQNRIRAGDLMEPRRGFFAITARKRQELMRQLSQ